MTKRLHLDDLSFDEEGWGRQLQSRRQSTPSDWREATTTLYFGNLPWAAGDMDLANAVAQFAQVLSARIVTDRETGRSRGFGVVEVSANEAQSVINALNGGEWCGRIMTVNVARPREGRTQLPSVQHGRGIASATAGVASQSRGLLPQAQSSATNGVGGGNGYTINVTFTTSVTVNVIRMR